MDSELDLVLESLKNELEMTVEGDVMMLIFLGIQSNCLPGGEIEINKLVTPKEC